MSKSMKLFSLAALFGALIIADGCGDGNDAPVVSNPSATASIAATVNANGTATTGTTAATVATPPGTPGYLAAVTATLPPGTVITAKNADGSTKALTAAPSLTFTAPADATAAVSGTNGVPAPTGFTTLTSTTGALDVQLTGAASATFSNPITITMPVPGKAVGSVIKVYTVTGTTYTLLGSFTVTTAGFVSFPVSSLSWKVADPNPDPNAPPTTVPTTAATTVATTTVPTTAATTVATTTVPTTAATTLATTTVPTTAATTLATTTVPTTAATTLVTTTVPTTVATTLVTTTVPTTVATTVSTTVATTTVLTTVATTTPTTVAAGCAGSCHGIPPATGQHTFHVTSRSISCSSCHGAGYSSTTFNSATHLNGVVNLVSSIGWTPNPTNALTGTCATPGCHGSRTW